MFAGLQCNREHREQHGDDSDAGKARCVNMPGAERHPAQERVRGQGKHRDSGEREGPRLRGRPFDGLVIVHPNSAMQA